MSNHQEKNILVAFFYLHGQYHKSPSREFLCDLHYTGDNRSIAFYRLFIDSFIHSFIHSLPTGFQKALEVRSYSTLWHPYFKLKKSFANTFNAWLRRG